MLRVNEMGYFETLLRPFGAPWFVFNISYLELVGVDDELLELVRPVAARVIDRTLRFIIMFDVF